MIRPVDPSEFDPEQIADDTPAAPQIPPLPPATRLPMEPGTSRPAAKPERARQPIESQVWLTRSDQFIGGILIAALLLLTGLHWARMSGWGQREVEIDRLQPRAYQYRINVNTAEWLEFALLPGIGETLALRIVEDRREHGPYRSVEELRRVKGIGPKTLDRIRDHLVIHSDDAPIETAAPHE